MIGKIGNFGEQALLFDVPAREHSNVLRSTYCKAREFRDLLTAERFYFLHRIHARVAVVGMQGDEICSGNDSSKTGNRLFVELEKLQDFILQNAKTNLDTSKTAARFWSFMLEVQGPALVKCQAHPHLSLFIADRIRSSIFRMLSGGSDDITEVQHAKRMFTRLQRNRLFAA